MKKLITLLLAFLPIWVNAQTEGEIRQAMDAYDYETPVTRIAPACGDSLLTPLRAQALKAMNRPAEALKEWNSLLKEDSTDTKVLIELAECYRLTNRSDQASLCYAKAVSLQSDNKFFRQQHIRTLLTMEEYESAREEYAAMTNEEGETDSFHINRQYNVKEYQNFSQFTMTGETSVYILSPYLYSILRDAHRLKPLSEVYTDGTLPEGAMPDGFGIALKDTDFYKYNPAAQIYPENAILCLHKPTISGRSKNEARYAEDVAFFKAIADFEVRE